MMPTHGGAAGRLVNRTRGIVLAPRVYRCEGWWQRAIGLLGRPRLSAGEALWLEPCNGVHTLGMRYAIDVLTLDRGLCVLRVDRALRPWRWVPPTRGGRVTLELAAGALPGAVAPGDQLALEHA